MRYIMLPISRFLAFVFLFSFFLNPTIYAQTVTVSGAGSTSYNQAYNYNGTTNSKPAYDYVCNTYDIYWDGAQWILNDGGDVYTNSNDTPKPPDTGWLLGTGTGPAPTMSGDVTALPFPVEFLDFEGESTNEKTIQLSWVTASELNNSGFEIQRSTATNTWETLGRVEGVGTSTELQSYTFTDSNFPAQRIAYRLKQIDFDGLYSFSRQIEVDMREKLAELELFPNPVKGSTLTLNIPGEDEARLSGNLYDIYGRQVAKLPLHSGENQIVVDDFSPGMYVLEIYFQGQTRIERFRVE